MSPAVLPGLDLALPVIAAPMAGGPSTPALVAAAGRSGGFGFLAGGYKTAEMLAAQIEEVRASTPVFGVNLFAPNPVPVEPASYRAYAALIQAEGEPYGLDLTAVPVREDDDEWQSKVGMLLETPVPVVSFTFGIPQRSVIAELRRAGSVTVQTVTSPSEAELAAAAGVDALAVQSHEAGAHYGTLTPNALPPPVPLAALVAQVQAVTDLPVLAAGGLATPAQVRAVISSGASAVMIGTHLLRTDESGASATYKAGLAARAESETIVTRAFTGRPARGIRNRFTERYDEVAPSGYPAVHYLTSPLRRAATEAGDDEVINLWAGTGHALAPEGPAAAAMEALGSEL